MRQESTDSDVLIGIGRQRRVSELSLWRELSLLYADIQALESVKRGRQAMIFVHSRKDTGKTGRILITKMQNANDASFFDCKDHPQFAFAQKDVGKSRNK